MIVIWDFDGVIADSFRCVHDVYLQIAQEMVLEVPNEFDDFRDAYGYNSREFLKGIGCTGERLEEWDRKYSELIMEQRPRMYEGIDRVLEWTSQHARQALLSASPEPEVLSKLERYGLSEMFYTVMAGEAGKGPMRKSIAIPQFLKSQGLSGEEVLFIADRTTDYHCAVKAGIPPNNIILTSYGWGFDEDKTPGRTHRPINTPKDLLLELQERLAQHQAPGTISS